jgi:hypothetical protein
LIEYSINGRAGWSNWTTDYAPAAGRNVVRVRQVDVAGNVSAASRALAFRLDTPIAAPASRSLPVMPAPELFSLVPTTPSRRSAVRPPIM